jgi:hypothetical protein
MGSPNGSNDTTHIPPPLSFYNTFNAVRRAIYITILASVKQYTSSVKQILWCYYLDASRLAEPLLCPPKENNSYQYDFSKPDN